MLQSLRSKLLLIVLVIISLSEVRAQLHRKPPGDIDREAPDTKEVLHREIHDIRARERQMKATRVYTSMNRISLERKKMKSYKRNGAREDYMKAQYALSLYKLHLKQERRRNRQMEVFD